MFTAFIISFVSWIFIICAALALSTDSGLVQKFSWARGSITATGYFTGTVDIGIRSVVITLTATSPFVFPANVSTVRSFAWDDDSACDGHAANLAETCASCQDAAGGVISWVITSIITQTIQIATDLQRTTPYGDVNCQKIMGVLTGVYGFVSGLRSAQSFADNCWNALPDSFTFPDYPHLGALDASWGQGTGWVLIFVATFLKAIDVICHLAVPTPPPKHLKPPKGLGALPHYCSVGPLDQPTRFGYPMEGSKIIGTDNAESSPESSPEQLIYQNNV